MEDEIDNWFDALDELKKFNTQAILVGHGHRNKKMNFEGVPGVMGRSNLRASNAIRWLFACRNQRRQKMTVSGTRAARGNKTRMGHHSP